jgi:hypothetical protein
MKYRKLWVELIVVTNIKISVLYNKIFLFTMDVLNEKKCNNKGGPSALNKGFE